jgi:hypothetical protein
MEWKFATEAKQNFNFMDVEKFVLFQFNPPIDI